MHETVIAENLLIQIGAEAQKQNAKPIIAKISCGVLNAINDEMLNFAFDAAAKGTLCENVHLQIEHKPLLAKCRNCNIIFEIDFSNPLCKQCNKDNFELIPDAPLVLEEIDFQTEQ